MSIWPDWMDINAAARAMRPRTPQLLLSERLIDRMRSNPAAWRFTNSGSTLNCDSTYASVTVFSNFHNPSAIIKVGDGEPVKVNGGVATALEMAVYEVSDWHNAKAAESAIDRLRGL